MKKNILSFLTLFVFITSMSAKEKSFPVISDEFRLGELSYTTEYYGGNNVKVGFDGTNYLVLWEYRDRIFGNLINSEGDILDGKNILYNLGYNSYQYQFNLFFDGDKFILVYDSNDDLVFLPIYTDGSSVQTGERVVSTDFISLNYSFYSVGFDGKNFLILNSENGSLYWSKFDNNGKRTEADYIFHNYSTIDAYSIPPLVFDGDNYFIIWWKDEICHGGWISPIDSKFKEEGIKNIFEIDLEFGPERILYDGTGYLLIDEKYGEDSEYKDLSTLKISKNGDIGDNKTLKIGTLRKYGIYHASFDGEYYNFFLNDVEYMPETDCGEYKNYLVWVRINRNGEVASKKCLSSYEFFAGGPSLEAAYNGNNTLLAFSLFQEPVTEYGGSNYIKSMILDLEKESQKGEDTVVTRRQSSQYDLDIAFDGTNYMAVWVEDTDDVEKIYGDIINESGKSLLETPFLISSGEINESQPSVAFNGNEYMVAWDQEKKIFGKRITTEGEIINSDTLIFNENAASSPEIVSDGSGYFLTWIKSYANSEEKMIFGMKISEKGEPLNPYPIEISESSSNYSKPEMIFDGENFFLVWMDNKNYVVFGKRISKNGLVLDNEDIPIVRGVPDNPKVIYNGEKYVVFSKSAEYIIIKTIEKDGSVNTEVKTVIDGIEKDFDVVYDGTNYLVVYGDYGDEYGTFKSIVLSEKFDLIVEPFDISEPFYKINELFSPAKFKTISGKNGTSLVFYTISSSVNQYSTDQRIFYRSVTSSELGSPCADESFCRSGFCVDSVCCESASCDDGNPDTEDSCSNTGKCVYEIISIESDDSNNSDSGCGCTIIF